MTLGDSSRTNNTELPLPEAHFRALSIGSRSTFQRWEATGLRVLKIGGRRFIYASDLRRFLESEASSDQSGEVGCEGGGGRK